MSNEHEHMDLREVRDFIANAHKGQLYDHMPYTTHLESVATWVSFLTDGSVTATTAALLHDVVEDTNTTIQTVNWLFGKDVADIVDLCTDPPGKNRAEQKAALFNRFRHTRNNTACLVKVCDRLDNVLKARAKASPHLDVYRDEHKEFRLAIYRPCSRVTRVQDLLDELLSGGVHKDKPGGTA